MPLLKLLLLLLIGFLSGEDAWALLVKLLVVKLLGFLIDVNALLESSFIYSYSCLIYLSFSVTDDC